MKQWVAILLILAVLIWMGCITFKVQELEREVTTLQRAVLMLQGLHLEMMDIGGSTIDSGEIFYLGQSEEQGD